MDFWARNDLVRKPAAAAQAAIAVLGLLWLTGVFQSPLPVYLAGRCALVRWGIELLRLGICLVPIAILLRHPRRLAAASRASWPVLLLVLLAAASAGWSIRPATTLHGATLLATTTLFGLFLGLAFEGRDQLRLLGLALGLVTVGNIAATVLFPDLSVMRGEHQGAWMGLYRHKNLLARDMALAVPVFVLLARERQLLPGLAWGLAAIAVGLIGASDSRTGALVATATTAIALLLSRRSGIQARRPWLLIAAATALAAAIAQSLPTLLELLGRDATLSGRTVLWSAVLDRIGARPWLGYGYDAFWVRSREAGGPAVEVAEQIGWLARHAHNGFLDVALDLGTIGLALFLAPLVGFGSRVVRGLGGRNPRLHLVWPAVFLAYWVLSNLTESPLVRHDHLGWALYVALIANGQTGGAEPTASSHSLRGSGAV